MFSKRNINNKWLWDLKQGAIKFWAEIILFIQRSFNARLWL